MGDGVQPIPPTFPLFQAVFFVYVNPDHPRRDSHLAASPDDSTTTELCSMAPTTLKRGYASRTYTPTPWTKRRSLVRRCSVCPAESEPFWFPSKLHPNRVWSDMAECNSEGLGWS